MAVRSQYRRREMRGLGVICLIFSLVHTPLPQPDFHNIRHHDAPGEVCEHHDHLLRWHPSAGAADDVSTLHWHWFLPTEEASKPLPENGPALHAHLPDGFASGWDDGPRIVADNHSEVVVRSLVCFQFTLSPDLVSPQLSILGPRSANQLGATAARQSFPISQLERWRC